jgi:hypothetical protein
LQCCPALVWKWQETVLIQLLLLNRFCSAKNYVNDFAIKFSCCFVCSVAAVHCFRNGREELWKLIICIFYFASFLSVSVISRDLTKRWKLVVVIHDCAVRSFSGGRWPKGAEATPRRGDCRRCCRSCSSGGRWIWDLRSKRPTNHQHIIRLCVRVCVCVCQSILQRPKSTI